MDTHRKDEGELTIKSDGVSIKGSAYEDLRPIVQGAVGIAAPFLEMIALLTGLSVGWVNQKLYNIGQRYEQKLNGIPIECRQLPALEIAASAIKGASVAANVTELQEMYSELLASASDTRRSDAAHPSFGSLISELEPLDARILAMFHNIKPRKELYLLEVMRAVGLSPNDPRIAVAVSNLSRQGLVEKSVKHIRSLHRRARGGMHNVSIRVSEIQSEIDTMRGQFEKYLDEQTSSNAWPICLTAFGSRFIAACVPGGDESSDHSSFG